jgi:hypothetical protein
MPESGFQLTPGVVPLNLQIQCVAREVALRKNYYPKRVARGQMKETEAQREIERMEAVLHTLQALAGRK